MSLLFVHEFVAGGGLAGRPLPRTLLAEGAAMLRALLADLGGLPDLEVVTTVDPRVPVLRGRANGVPGGFPPSLSTAAPRIRSIPVPPDSHARVFTSLLDGADYAWIVAPETRGCLARLTELAEARGVRVVGSSSSAVRLAADKLALLRRLRQARVPVPRTWSLEEFSRLPPGRVRPPLVIKPATGAGCEGVRRVETAAEVRAAAEGAGGPARGWIVQELVRGRHASASVLRGAERAVAVSLNGQRIEGGRAWRYRGGWLPLVHPGAAAALEAARRACEEIPGLRGYAGVDMVLSPEGPVVIEVNPRLTTSYVGLRQAVEGNVAAAARAAATRGEPPRELPVVHPVRFTADGRVVRRASAGGRGGTGP